MPPTVLETLMLTRRQALQAGASALAVMALPGFAMARTPSPAPENTFMSENFVTTKDGVRIFYKDWARAMRSPSSSTTVGRCRRTTGTPRCCTSCRRATA